jgi:hypothetical protein
LKDLQKKYKDLSCSIKELVDNKDKDKPLEGLPQDYINLLLDDK